MFKAVVTGAAGFIGSTLCRALLAEDVEVVGIDKFTPYYWPQRKWRNIADLQMNPRFTLVHDDLATADLVSLYGDATVVFHLAGQPGVRTSWSTGFDEYVTENVLATQCVLEAAREHGDVRVVYASSSSVYGNAERYPCRETDRPAPFSPYGVTKLAGEHLAVLYARNYGVSTVSLRFFTVYGPSQRPEMAIAQMIDAALKGNTFNLFAARGAVRDFTYVDDIVRAVILAGRTPDLPPGLVLNVCGGEPATMIDVLEYVHGIVGEDIPVDLSPAMPGDVLRTGGDNRLAREALGWRPTTRLFDGVLQQVLWRASELGLSTPRLDGWMSEPVRPLRTAPVAALAEPAV
ncbi:putative UDP-glucose epimerase YtcB [Terrabacter tumescens]|uniref:UDP-glucose epimerase YtcB n=1 Tax=Terrabacter tumescens TaxID=60443 RepID=A0ABQ2HYN6_9MICO|nr:NAD-dependent epimerase/dehydratase family protein [Terrabacter tumescens]GGM94641.1 putative UDP-glucose epimerase YtcB [Terrabacter tumescens]